MTRRFKHILFLFILIAASPLCRAQGEGRTIHALAGPAGNYLYLLIPPAGEAFDSLKAMAADYYLIERAPVDTQRGTIGEYKEIGRSRPVQNARQLREYYTERNITELQRAFELPGESALVDYFRDHRNPAHYGMYYLVLQTKLATGDVYLDKSARRGLTYSYRATRVDRAGGQEMLGNARVKTGAPNPLLPLFHPRMRSVSATDTVLLMSWKIPVDSLTAKPPRGVDPNMLAFIADGLKARVMLDNGTGYELAEQLLPAGNDSETTRNLNFRAIVKPERQYNAYVLLEDEVGNQGLPSDTLVAFSIGPSNMPKLGSLRTKEVPDGVRLSWPRITSKPYIAGVKLMRYGQDDQGVQVAIVPVSDTAYIDYTVEPGVTYRYFGELLFLPGTGLAEIAPAQTVGAATVFSDPQPPFNLRASNSGERIRLDWDAQKQASIFGYYIYRGTSPKSLELVAGPVRGQMHFIDTAHYLSGRSQYFYAVQAQNYRQVMSPLTEAVGITPARKVQTIGPRTLEFYYTTGVLHIRFPDVREDDNAIVGYIVRGKEGASSAFRFRSGLLTSAHVEDSIGFDKGRSFQYQVAAISMRGDTSAWSDFHEFNLSKNPVEQVGVFYLRNTSEGISISWPAATYENRKAYNIYRRRAVDETFERLAAVPVTQFSYTDGTVKTGEVYVYSISATESDDREGERSPAKSLRREPVKATIISE